MEWANQELEKFLRCFVSTQASNWSKFHVWVEYAYNTLPNSSTGLSPFECQFGYPRFLNKRPKRGCHQPRRSFNYVAAPGSECDPPCSAPLPNTNIRQTGTEGLFGYSDLGNGLVRTSPFPPTPAPLPPGVVDGLPAYNVRGLLEACRVRSTLQHLVDWEGYGPEERVWVPARDILDQGLVWDFNQLRGGCPGSTAEATPRRLVRTSPFPPTPAPLPPGVVDGLPAYNVRGLLEACRVRSTLQHLVDWEGYGPEERVWVPARDILDQGLVWDFNQLRGGCPGSTAEATPRRWHGHSSGQGREGQGRAEKGRAEKVIPGQRRLSQGRAEKVRAEKVRAGQRKSSQGRAEKVSSGQVSSGQGREEQGREEQGREGQPRAEKISSGQGRESQPRAGHRRLSQGRSGQGREGQLRAGQGRVEKVISGQARAGQRRSSQGRAGQRRSSQGKPGQGREGHLRAGQGSAEQGHLRAGQGRSRQRRSSQGRSGQRRSSQGRAGQGREGHLRAEKVISGQGRAEKVISGQVRAEKVISGQGRAGQGREGHLRAEKVISGQGRAEKVISGQGRAEKVISGQVRRHLRDSSLFFYTEMNTFFQKI
eukprot:XP_014054493.1 PREDICTED: uncharacterized protein LOC106604419 [Salmo salar]